MPNIKQTIRQLAGTTSTPLPPPPAPENINGKKGVIIWGTEGSGDGGAGGESPRPPLAERYPPGQGPPVYCFNLPEPETPKACNWVASQDGMPTPSFQIFGWAPVVERCVAEPVFSAQIEGGRLFVRSIGWNTSAVFDERDLGFPTLDLMTAGGDYRTRVLFDYLFDYEGRHYGLVSTSTIKTNPNGSKEYLVSATINLARNYMFMYGETGSGQRMKVLREGFGNTSLLESVASSYRQVIDPMIGAPLGYSAFDTESSEPDYQRRSSASGALPSGTLTMTRYELFYPTRTEQAVTGYSLSSDFYDDDYIAGNLPYIYAPGVKDYYKVVMSKNGNITSVEPLHLANLEDYVPFMASILAAKAGMWLDNHPVATAYFDIEIGREYKSKVNADVNPSTGEIMWTELSVNWTKLVRYQSRDEPDGFEIGFNYNGHEKKYITEWDESKGSSIEDFDLHRRRTVIHPELFAGTYNDLETRAQTFGAFLSVFRNGTIQIREHYYQLGADEDGVYLHRLRKMDYQYRVEGDANGVPAGVFIDPSVERKFYFD